MNFCVVYVVRFPSYDVLIKASSHVHSADNVLLSVCCEQVEYQIGHIYST